MNGKEQQICGACGGSGWIKQAVLKTEYEPRTVSEWVTVQVGDHTEMILQTRIEQVPVQRIEWRDFVCSTCGGSGRV